MVFRHKIGGHLLTLFKPPTQLVPGGQFDHVAVGGVGDCVGDSESQLC
jgi:hypothetical protein